MKVKEFLEQFDRDYKVEIQDKCDYSIHKFDSIEQATSQYGHYTVSLNDIIDDTIVIAAHLILILKEKNKIMKK